MSQTKHAVHAVATGRKRVAAPQDPEVFLREIEADAAAAAGYESDQMEVEAAAEAIPAPSSAPVQAAEVDGHRNAMRWAALVASRRVPVSPGPEYDAENPDYQAALKFVRDSKAASAQAEHKKLVREHAAQLALAAVDFDPTEYYSDELESPTEEEIAARRDGRGAPHTPTRRPEMGNDFWR